YDFLRPPDQCFGLWNFGGEHHRYLAVFLLRRTARRSHWRYPNTRRPDGRRIVQLSQVSSTPWHLLPTPGWLNQRLAHRRPPIGPPLADRFINWAQGALALGLPEIDEPVRLLWAMALGWKTALTGEVSEPFMRSGTKIG